MRKNGNKMMPMYYTSRPEVINYPIPTSLFLIGVDLYIIQMNRKMLLSVLKWNAKYPQI